MIILNIDNIERVKDVVVIYIDTDIYFIFYITKVCNIYLRIYIQQTTQERRLKSLLHVMQPIIIYLLLFQYYHINIVKYMVTSYEFFWRNVRNTLIQQLVLSTEIYIILLLRIQGLYNHLEVLEMLQILHKLSLVIFSNRFRGFILDQNLVQSISGYLSPT